MALITVSTTLTVVTLNVHQREPHEHLPRVLRHSLQAVFLPRVLMLPEPPESTKQKQVCAVFQRTTYSKFEIYALVINIVSIMCVVPSIL